MEKSTEIERTHDVVASSDSHADDSSPEKRKVEDTLPNGGSAEAIEQNASGEEEGHGDLNESAEPSKKFKGNEGQEIAPENGDETEGAGTDGIEAEAAPRDEKGPEEGGLAGDKKPNDGGDLSPAKISTAAADDKSKCIKKIDDAVGNFVSESAIAADKLFTADKISELAHKNIFEKPGAERVKKNSLFLQQNYISTAQQSSSRECAGHFARACRLSYLDTDQEEWIPCGDGEAHVSGGKFIFVRQSFKTVLLNFDYKGTVFSEDDGKVYFVTRSVKSLGEHTELVDRKYQLEFEQLRGAQEFLDLVN